MARHSAMQIVPEFMLKSSLDIKKHVSVKLLDVLMWAVKVEALFGETIVSLEPITEEPGPETETISFRQAVNLTPLVRCRECEHYNAGFECLIEGYGIERPADYFCADGKRKGGQDDA